jgi:hypothetical protein
MAGLPIERRVALTRCYRIALGILRLIGFCLVQGLARHNVL